MSTRTNIEIVTPDQTIWLYRHHDGYLAVTGADIVRKIQCALKHDHARGAISLANQFLSDCYPADSVREARPAYELTDDKHGDVDYVYHITVDADHISSITYDERKVDDDYNDYWMPAQELTIDAVNKAIAEMGDEWELLDDALQGWETIRDENMYTLANMKPVNKVQLVENKEKKGIELVFSDKPSDEIRKTLKLNGWRWHRGKSCWYVRDSERARNVAAELLKMI